MRADAEVQSGIMTSVSSDRPSPLHNLPQQEWPVVVIGAGLAGAFASYLLARDGQKVLLVDSKEFPRTKVCGCCLNNRGVSYLQQGGAEDLLQTCGAVPLNSASFHYGRSQVDIDHLGGVVVSRAALDTALTVEACQSGATFLPQTTATVLPAPSTNEHGGKRLVKLEQGGACITVEAQIVIAADGLNRSSLKHVRTEFPETVSEKSWLGIGATLTNDALHLPTGHLQMYVGCGGYLGVVRFRDSRLNFAAAISRSMLKAAGSPSAAARAIVRKHSSLASLLTDEVDWLGTGPLTRRSHVVAKDRCFLIGDAAGYVEPFTGEGMTWALGAATALVPLVHTATQNGWTKEIEQAWARELGQTVRLRQQWCHRFASALKHSWMISAGFFLGRAFPSLPRRIAKVLATPP
jgi:menaquinone-9 beta-reductase